MNFPGNYAAGLNESLAYTGLKKRAGAGGREQRGTKKNNQ